MKKIVFLFLAALMVLSAFVACENESEDESSASDVVDSSDAIDSTVVRIGGMKGPTTIGMVKLIEDTKNGDVTGNYEFKIETDASSINQLLIKGELDVAALPANVASTLYNKTNGEVQVLAINTLGVLYVLEKGDEIKSIADLKGKTICATGKGTTPEYSLRYILSENGIDPDKDITIEWKSETTEVLSALKLGTATIAMVPQPFATVAQEKVDGLHIALNLNDEWNKINTESMLVTGVLVARKEFVQNHPALIAELLKEYEKSIEYVKANPTEASVWVEEAIGVQASSAEKAIPFCNLSYIAGAEMKNALSGYLSTLYDADSASVGGKLPGDDFYYAG